MDFKMNAERISSAANPVWDAKVVDGIVPIVHGNEEKVQTATLAGFLEQGTIPLLPDVGVNWQAFLTGEITFGELDTAIRQSIQDAGVQEFGPSYDIVDDELTLTINAGDA